MDRRAPRRGFSLHSGVALGLLTLGCGPTTFPSGPNCKAFVACFEATGGTKGALDSTFGAMGSCWTTTDEAEATCNRTCALELKNLQLRFPDAGCKDR